MTSEAEPNIAALETMRRSQCANTGEPCECLVGSVAEAHCERDRLTAASQKFIPLEPWTQEWEEWLDGPQPRKGEPGRAQWMNGRRLRKRRLAELHPELVPETVPVAVPELGQVGDVVSEAVSLMRKPSTPAAVKATLLKLIHETQRGPAIGVPTSVAQVRAMTDAELHELVHARGLALPWPVDPEPLQVQAL